MLAKPILQVGPDFDIHTHFTVLLYFTRSPAEVKGHDFDTFFFVCWIINYSVSFICLACRIRKFRVSWKLAWVKIKYVIFLSCSSLIWKTTSCCPFSSCPLHIWKLVLWSKPAFSFLDQTIPVPLNFFL